MRVLLLGICLALLFLELCVPYVESLSFSSIKNGNSLTNADEFCPSPEAIAPCVCTHDVEVHLTKPNMDCKSIEDDNVLEQVFNASFPVKDFHILNVHNSHGFQNLKNGVFGEVTFEVVIFDTTRLEKVEREVFQNSVSTLKELRFIFNNIRDDFPFDILKDFVLLEKFEVNSCQNTNNYCLTRFPLLDVPQLNFLGISDQSFDSLPDNPFQGIPNIEVIVINQNHLTDIQKGILENLHSLKRVIFGNNKLSNLSEGLFTMNSENLNEIGLEVNHFENFHKNAFVGLDTSSKDIHINLLGNGIRTLDRLEFEPLVSRGVYINLRGNPLECGCDADWVVFIEDYHQYLAEAECGEHGLLIDQDVGWYEANC